MNNVLKVEKAQREKLKLPILLQGVSGSGKTLSALLLAYGIVEAMFPGASQEELWMKVGVIDTEHRRASLYVNSEKAGQFIGEFQVVNLPEPFSVDRYEEGFYLLVNAGCEVVIMDSVSHNWEGEGGILDEHTRLGGQFNNWKDVKPIEKRFRRLAMHDQVHVISTARVKQDYIVEPNEKGKMAPRKIGLKMIQKDNLEYEFAVSFRIEQGAVAYPMKDNSGIFETPRQLTAEDGRKLYEWSEIGIDVAKIERERREKEERERMAMAAWITGQNEPRVQMIVNQAQAMMRLPIDQFDYVSTLNLYKEIKGVYNT